jgi:hypothetical protein
MGDRGLHTSIWAPKHNGEAQHFLRPADWTCPSCGFSNFERRMECFRCSFTATSAGPKGDAVGRNSNGQPDMMPPPQDMDNHSRKGGHEEAIRSGFQGHTTPGPIEDPTRHIPKAKNERVGLSTSRWAPRHSGSHKISGNGKVWTRVRLKSPDSGQ